MQRKTILVLLSLSTLIVLLVVLLSKDSDKSQIYPNSTSIESKIEINAENIQYLLYDVNNKSHLLVLDENNNEILSSVIDRNEISNSLFWKYSESIHGKNIVHAVILDNQITHIETEVDSVYHTYKNNKDYKVYLGIFDVDLPKPISIKGLGTDGTVFYNSF
ncbi:hypothetical protein [Bacillus horti]|uniref:Uncharacterized protein n=1 Tax=Caldalkalibacillus horti TaxID=77523 RepID=A0ABT9W1N6_9BACI|nr:hypothetical protein [Bacillus horti]MDQ0167126.1 hypothetical protein [Bacillus horti]